MRTQRRHRRPLAAAITLVLGALGTGWLGACSTPREAAPTAPVPIVTAATDRPTTVAGATPTLSAPTEPTPRPRVTATPPVQPALVEAAMGRVQSYLDTWIRDGCAAAATAYRGASEQASTARDCPRLISGRARLEEVHDWRSADDFTLLLALDLHFAGDPGAWGEGANERFVTFTRTTPGQAWALSLATGP